MEHTTRYEVICTHCHGFGAVALPEADQMVLSCLGSASAPARTAADVAERLAQKGHAMTTNNIATRLTRLVKSGVVVMRGAHAGRGRAQTWSLPASPRRRRRRPGEK